MNSEETQCTCNGSLQLQWYLCRCTWLSHSIRDLRQDCGLDGRNCLWKRKYICWSSTCTVLRQLFMFSLSLDSSSPVYVYYFTYRESTSIAQMTTAWTNLVSLLIFGLVSRKFGLKLSLSQRLQRFTSVTVRRKKVPRPMFTCLVSSRCLRSSCSFALRFIITIHTRKDII